MTIETLEETQGTQETQETQDIQDAGVLESEDTETLESKETEEAKGKYTEEEKIKYSRTVQTRIDELTRQRYEEKRRADTLDARLRELEKKIIVGEKPQPPNIKNYVDEIGNIDEAKYQQDIQSHGDHLLKWDAAHKKVEAPPATEESNEPDPMLIEKVAAFVERGEAIVKTYPDYTQAVNAPVFTKEMQQTLLDFENGADIAYYLGKNPTEAVRIGNLPPLQVGIELGKLNIKFSAPSPAKKLGALPPITPLKGADTVSKDPSKMSIGEWMAWNKARDIERLKQKHGIA